MGHPVPLPKHNDTLRRVLLFNVRFCTQIETRNILLFIVYLQFVIYTKAVEQRYSLLS